ncbi:CLUMA_CG017031, isoform A [Clunio marinus]|uniref:CLUMA_CG017031, isoform A n=1 Tax=Clunio marinus TaxID=568069 RepID=A0A1J1IXL9_9DIPT|nr:CLUMA_CG017031, isoform A [Clunio marinus]
MKKFNIFYAVFAFLLVTSAICNETKENLVDVDDESENMTLSDVKNNDSEKDIEMESVEMTTTLNELEIKNNKSETLEVETTTPFETTTQVTTTIMPSLKTLQFNPEDLNVTKSLIKEIA